MEGAALARAPFTKRHLRYDLVGRNGLRSGRLPRATQRDALTQRLCSISQYRNQALGNSREPPVFTFPGRKTP